MEAPREPAALRAAVEAFLVRAGEPVVFEPGQEQIRLERGAWELETRGGRLMLQAWDETRNLCRRITSVRGEKPGTLELAIERFGGREGTLFLLDLARVRRPDTQRRSRRLVFREQIRRSLHRQFPGWTIAELSTERFLEASLGETCVRAMLKRGTSGWAVLAAQREAASVAGALTRGLIWLDYLRTRERRISIGGLALFLPDGREHGTCSRLRWLDRNAARFDVFVYSEDGYEEAVDPAEYSNLQTKLEACRPGHGHTGGDELRLAVTPEAAIETALYGHLDSIDAALRPAPVYRQVIGSAGTDRGIIDLLAVDHAGRLAVLELKASEDVHLPVQALDYWMQILWHLERGEFERRGYFPGVELRREAPLLYLVAPALQFHPKTETILQYFDPAVEVVRIGLAAGPVWDHSAGGGHRVEWRQGPMFRIRGARRPC